jgi:type II secretory pathway component PulF
MKINFKDLSLFTYSMSSCLSSGLPIERSLELCGLKSHNSTLRNISVSVIEKVKRGMLLHEALLPYGHKFPSFFIPVIRCGEESGRMGEVFSYLSEYLSILEPMRKVIRQAWFNPVVILSFGRGVPILVCLILGKMAMAWQFIYPTVPFLAAVVFGVYLLCKIKVTKRMIDWVLLQIPLISETLISLSASLFLKSFSLMYKSGGMPAAQMVQLSADTVGNSVLCKDFHRVHEAVLEQRTFSEAFQQSKWLGQIYKDQIATGELSGKLDKHVDQVVKIACDDVEFRLEIFNSFFHRLLAYAVAGAIGLTIYGIFMANK